MDILKFIILILFCSCAKLEYLWEQGVGQIQLKWHAKANEKLLSDPSVPDEIKAKIKMVQEYKDFFYQYFEQPSTDIYSQTTILDQPAVTYLVIASPYTHIEALEHSFPLMGKFPYLGFFKESSAIAFEQTLEADYVTYRRPVYAYSTLGYFNDPILSSFFHYDKLELAELIFHELFHTIFFIANDIDFNENVANFFGEQLVNLYFKSNPIEIAEYKNRKKQSDHFNEKIVELVKELSKKYQENTKKDKQESEKILLSFLTNRFRPQLQKICDFYHLAKCHILQKDWNNARFAAFLTYEKNQNTFKRLKEKTGLELKDFYHYLWERYRNYKNIRPTLKIDFLEYLEQT